MILTHKKTNTMNTLNETRKETLLIIKTLKELVIDKSLSNEKRVEAEKDMLQLQQVYLKSFKN
tara:strand:- start:498 stop:686 length:189 start_codon:yes stop_codon:yes gene_type:complete